MSQMIKPDVLAEGVVFCRWLQSRLLRNNKNVLGAELGPTGSGKSYRDLRKAELWYKDYLHRPFPSENICFGVHQIMKRLTSDDLKKGDVLIFEEAGANLGSLDFQNKVSKMFTYVLQSFRSMNIAIFFNLPYLSMLNKQARMLLHYSSESAGIDFGKNQNKCKIFFHQVNQGTGKIYKKYPKAIVKHKARQIKRFNWELPAKELQSIYERKKTQYLGEMQESFMITLKNLQDEETAKLERPVLTEKQQAVYNLMVEGLNGTEIAKTLGKSPSTICDSQKAIKKKGYSVKKGQITRDFGKIGTKTPPNSRVPNLVSV